MVRISDILRKARGDNDKDKDKKPSAEQTAKQSEASPTPEPVSSKPSPAPPQEVNTPAEEAKTPAEKPRPEPPTAQASVSAEAIKASGALSPQETEQLYEQNLTLVKEILKEKIDYGTLDIPHIIVQIEKLIEQLSLGNDTLMMLALTKESSGSHYIFCHTLNTCILCIKIGLGLDYEKTQLKELGFAALFHDIGMVRYLHLAKQPRKLAPQEYEQIQRHSQEGREILKNIKEVMKGAAYVAEQHHERLDGSGYPHSLTEESMDEYAKILSAVDVYEAMMHSRAYRDEYLPIDAIQAMLKAKDAFEYKVKKLLIEVIGIFPLGSLVLLNTGEIGQVVKNNNRIPLRPQVEIIATVEGQKPEASKRIDLARERYINIKRGMTRKELQRRHIS